MKLEPFILRGDVQEAADLARDNSCACKSVEDMGNCAACRMHAELMTHLQEMEGVAGPTKT